MARRRDEQGDQDMVDVVLVAAGTGPDDEDDLLPVEPPAPEVGPAHDRPDDGPSAAGTPSTGRLGAASRAARAVASRHRRTTAVVAVLAVLAGTLLAASDIRQADLRRTRWAQLAAVALPMDAGARELWRVDLTATALVAFGHGLYLERERSGDLRALDADTAAVVWTVPSSSVITGGSLQSCVAVDSEPPTFVCPSNGADGSAALVVLTAADGSEVARRSVPVEPSIVVAEGPDLVLGAPAPDGGLDVRREDAVTGDERWEHHVVPTASAPAESDELVLSWGLQWRVADGALLVSDPPAAVDLETGDVLPWARQAGQVTTNVEAIVDGGWATGPAVPTGEAGSAFDADGSVRFVFDGSPLDLLVDDGSRPDLLLVRSWPMLKALDARTGDVRWTSRDLCGDGNPAVRLEGSLLCTLEAGGEGAVGRIDLATGEEIWRRAVGPVDGMSVATDGRRVVVLGGGPGRRPVTSYAWDDGEPGWATFVAADVRALWVADRRLYGIGGGTLVRLG